MSIEAMPFLNRDPQSAWARSMDLRDLIYQTVEEACRRLDVSALVNKSIDFVFPAWVTFEAWLPAGSPGATHRRLCVIWIDPKPHSTYEFELRIECTRDGKKKNYGPFQPQAVKGLDAWVGYMLDQGPRPSKSALRLRKLPWQLWHPNNKITSLDYDALKLGMGASLAVGFFGSLIHPIVSAIGWIGAVVCYVLVWRRKPVIVNLGRPLAEPRTLRLVDSWQTIVSDIGSDWESVRTRLFRRLTEGRTYDIKPRLENISYVTPDGKQVRQQLVLTQGRGIVFCHAYPYGNDMYVAWEAYLNYGQWAERQVSTGFNSKLQSPVTINTVTPGTSRVTEYDLIDLNGLSEWTHTRVVQVVKQVLAEHKLDQEIDFKITQRGARGDLVSHQVQEQRQPLFRRGSAAH